MRSNSHHLQNPKMAETVAATFAKFLGQFDGDPLATAQAVGWLLDMTDEALEPARVARVAAIRRLRADGWTLAEIATETGLTRARVHAIAER